MASPGYAVLQPDALFQERYRIVRCIKGGGMGAVYEVVDERTDSRRALKVMLPSLVEDADLRARFELEARVTGMIESDHLARVSDAGIDEATGMPFLVMDLLHGEELGSMLARRKSLPPGEVVLYLFEAALALDKTHAAGIVHRDLKPANLFVTRRDDGSPCVKVFDFGIAKIVDRGSKRSTRAMGTPLYMAPEQIRGEGSLGPPADLYALGHIAYTLLVGEAYWDEEVEAGQTPFATMSTIVVGAKEPPSTRAMRRRGVALPAAFDAWFFKTTAPLPENRFGRATDAVAALALALGVSLPRAGLSAAPLPTATTAIAGGGTTPLTEVAAGALHGGPQVMATEPMDASVTKPTAVPPQRGRTFLAGAVAAVTVIAAAASFAALMLRGTPSSGERVPLARPALTNLLPAPPSIESAASNEPAPPAASATAAPAASASAAPVVPTAVPARPAARPPAVKPNPARPATTRTHEGIF